MSAQRRIDVTLVVGGWWHDFDYARLQILQLLADDVRLRTQVRSDYEDLDRLAATDVLITYTCNVRPSEAAQQAMRRWVEGGGRWFALHGTNSAIDPPERMGAGPFTTPRVFPTFADTLGSQFLSHPAIEPYTVTVSPGAVDDPLVAGIDAFDATDELYLSELHGELDLLLETRWTGDSGPGFAEREWPHDEPRPVMYRRPVGDGCVLYLTLGHCRSHYDMIAPPFNGMYWPTIERGSWELPVFHELLRRGVAWCVQPFDAAASSDTVRDGG
jgi:type 1 glutamine amidotransferase